MAQTVRRWRRIRSERGAELIEFAIVTPLLLLILAGIFDFGMLFRSWEVVTNAAREGARVGSLPGYADGDINARVQQYLHASGAIPATGTCTLSCTPSACSVCVQTDTVPTGSNNVTVRSVRVLSQQTLPSLSWVGVFFGGSFGTVTVGSTSVMRTESGPVP
jgi:Flp pilus assembly protein TadG